MQKRVPRFIETSTAPRSKGRSRAFALLMGMLLFGSIVFGGAIWTAPPLIVDWPIRDLVRADNRVNVSDVKCRSLTFLHSCNVTIRLNFGSETATRTINYVFTGPLERADAVQALVDPDHHDIITTDFGLERLWNRTWTLGLGMLPFLWAFALTCYGLILVATEQAPSKR